VGMPTPDEHELLGAPHTVQREASPRKGWCLEAQVTFKMSALNPPQQYAAGLPPLDGCVPPATLASRNSPLRVDHHHGGSGDRRVRARSLGIHTAGNHWTRGAMGVRGADR